MKKLTKILLPIASTVAVATPMVCMTSCGLMEETKIVTNFNFEDDDTLMFTYKAKVDQTNWDALPGEIISKPEAIEGFGLNMLVSLKTRNDGYGTLVVYLKGTGFKTFYAEPKKGDKFVMEVKLVQKSEKGKEQTVKLTAICDPDIK